MNHLDAKKVQRCKFEGPGLENGTHFARFYFPETVQFKCLGLFKCLGTD